MEEKKGVLSKKLVTPPNKAGKMDLMDTKSRTCERQAKKFSSKKNKAYKIRIDGYKNVLI